MSETPLSETVPLHVAYVLLDLFVLRQRAWTCLDELGQAGPPSAGLIVSTFNDQRSALIMLTADHPGLQEHRLSSLLCIQLERAGVARGCIGLHASDIAEDSCGSSSWLKRGK